MHLRSYASILKTSTKTGLAKMRCKTPLPINMFDRSSEGITKFDPVSNEVTWQ